MPNQYTVGTIPLIPPEVRFWPKVNKHGPIPAYCPELGPCWIWTASKYTSGRGQFYFNGRMRFAHVVAYILTTGHEPPAETPNILHHCDGGAIACVRPSHVYAGTKRDNARDASERGQMATGDRHGARTHPESIARGERNGHARLTATQVIEMRRRYAAGGISMSALGAAYGMSQPSVCGIINRKRWKHLDP